MKTCDVACIRIVGRRSGRTEGTLKVKSLLLALLERGKGLLCSRSPLLAYFMLYEVPSRQEKEIWSPFQFFTYQERNLQPSWAILLL